MAGAAEGLERFSAPHLPDWEKNCERRQLLRTLSGTMAPQGGSAGNGTETKQETARSKGDDRLSDLSHLGHERDFVYSCFGPWQLIYSGPEDHTDCLYLKATFATWHLNSHESSSTLMQGQPPLQVLARCLHSFLLQIQVLTDFVSLSVLYMVWTLECSQVFQHQSDNRRVFIPFPITTWLCKKSLSSFFTVEHLQQF